MPKDTILFTLGHHTRNLISKEDDQRQYGLTISYSGQNVDTYTEINGQQSSMEKGNTWYRMNVERQERTL